MASSGSSKPSAIASNSSAVGSTQADPDEPVLLLGLAQRHAQVVEPVTAPAVGVERAVHDHGRRLDRAWSPRSTAPMRARWPMKVAARAHVPPFAVMEILAAANARRAAGEDVLNLCAGEPSTGASDVVRQRAIDLLTAAATSATPRPWASRRCASAIAQHYRDRYDVALDPVADRRHHGLVRRVRPRVPRGVRRGRPGGARRPRLPRVREHPRRARVRGRDRPVRPGDPLPADRRAARGARPARSRGWWSPARPTRPAR